MTTSLNDDLAAFRALRDTPLPTLFPAQTVAFAEAMARWLTHPDRSVREEATERLATAVLWERAAPGMPPSREEAYWAERLGWLFGVVEAAAAVQPDVLPLFLMDMRFRNPSGLQIPIVETWLDRLDRDPPPGLDRDLVLATRLTMERDIEGVSAKRWIALLDHRSDWVRACAARRLAACDEEGDPTEEELVRLIGEKEIERPGIAGPFRGERIMHENDPAIRREVALWMMDLLERRRGPAPADLPYNDIEFHLHELCAVSPDMVDRMMRGGFVDLALMTATEMHEPVEGMEARLELLSRNPRPGIAQRAANHLAAYYAQPRPPKSV